MSMRLTLSFHTDYTNKIVISSSHGSSDRQAMIPLETVLRLFRSQPATIIDARGELMEIHLQTITSREVIYIQQNENRAANL